MRILVVQDADWMKKGPHQQHHLIELLSCRGHEVVVIGFDHLWRDSCEGMVSVGYEIAQAKRVYQEAQVKYVRPTILRAPLLDYVSYLISSRRAVNGLDFEPEVVVGFTSLLSCFWGLRYARRKRVPFVYYWTDEIHTLIPYRALRPLGKLIERHILRRSDIGVAINEGLREQMSSVAPGVRTVVIPGGVDSKRFNPEKTRRQAIRQSHGLTDGQRVLFFMGWVYEFSGLQDVVTEMARTRDSNKNLRLIVVGDGEYLSKLETLICQLGMKDRVILTGRRPYDEIPDLIASADICILPARNNETMRNIVPIKMYEYLAMHKPVISTKLPGVMKELPAESGIIFVEKSQEVVKAASALSSGEMHLMEIQADRFIMSYQWHGIVDRFENLLSELLKG